VTAGAGAGGWVEANHRWLAAAVASMEVRLRGYLGLLDGGGSVESVAAAGPVEAVEAAARLDEAAAALPGPSALDRLAAAYRLSGFERDVLLLLAADELDSRVGASCAAASGGRHDHPTFGLALAALDGPHWSATAPGAPLRAARLVEVGDGRLTGAPLHLDERVLHCLLGLPGPDRRLLPYLVPVHRPAAPLPASLAAVGTRLRGIWATGEHPVATLYGPEQRDLAATVAAAAADLPVYAVSAADLPPGAADRETFARLWEREALLDGAVLVADCHQGGPAERAAVAALVARVEVPIVITAADPLPLPRAGVVIEVGRPRRDEQRSLWRAVLDGAVLNGAGLDGTGLDGTGLNGAARAEPRSIDEATMQFDLGYVDIADAAGAASAAGEGAPEHGGIWELCRVRSRSRLDELAMRIEPRARWRDLVLPADQSAILRDIAAQVRGRSRVYHDWGFERVSQRGLGISALFCGPSGTGKTLAAEVIAAELGLDLYLIDLSAVVSKYIGETEKNLRAVFDSADKGGAVLLFDEADALFGKRTEVRDSHDRYANIEVSYLLQRMESYRGLAVLTTNLRSALDQAFLRRLRFVVQFPFPDVAQRTEIWRRVFPDAVPTGDLDASRLAQLTIAGGNIRNIAIAAAFLAAGDDNADAPVTMAHVLRAARAEYAKFDKPLTAVETGGWP